MIQKDVERIQLRERRQPAGSSLRLAQLRSDTSGVTLILHPVRLAPLFKRGRGHRVKCNRRQSDVSVVFGAEGNLVFGNGRDIEQPGGGLVHDQVLDRLVECLAA